LEGISDLLSLCQRFLSFLGSEGLGLDQRSVCELDLFEDALKLSSLYVDVESHYFYTVLRRAIADTEPMEVSNGVHISSMAEDVFFIVRDKTLDRAMATGSEQAVLAMAHTVVSALDATPRDSDQGFGSSESSTATSLFRAVEALPETSLGALAVRTALEGYRSHRRAVKARRAVVGVGGNVSSGSSGSSGSGGGDGDDYGDSGGGGDRGGGDRGETLLEDLVAGLTEQMDAEVFLDAAEVGALLSLVAATNSADACAVSVNQVQAFIEDSLALTTTTNEHDCADNGSSSSSPPTSSSSSSSSSSSTLADKLAATTGADLLRVERAYSSLRDSFVERLVEDPRFFANPLAKVRSALRAKSFILDAADYASLSVPGGSGGGPGTTRNNNPQSKEAPSSSLSASRRSASTDRLAAAAGGAPKQQQLLSLSEICRDRLLDSCAFVTVRSRLTPTALGALLHALAARFCAMVGDLFVGGVHKVNEWGALQLQREARDLEGLFSSLVAPSSQPHREPHEPLSGAFSELERTVLLLNLDRPADLHAFYPQVAKEMEVGRLRVVLAARFSDETVAKQLKL